MYECSRKNYNSKASHKFIQSEMWTAQSLKQEYLIISGYMICTTYDYKVQYTNEPSVTWRSQKYTL